MELKAGYKQTEAGVIPEDWHEAVLDEVCWFQEGPGVRNTQFTSFGVKLLNGTNIFRGDLKLNTTTRFISEDEAYGRYLHFLADAGDIVIASSGVTIQGLHEKVAFVHSEDLPFCMNTSTVRFKVKSDDLLQAFLYQFLMSDAFKQSIGRQATGSAQLNFGPSHIATVPIALPPASEQKAIVKTLSDIDELLVSLEAIIVKKRDLKQAAMQQLLTGQTRLTGFDGVWDIKIIGEIAEIVSGGTPSTRDFLYWNGDIKWCTPTDITRCQAKYINDTERKITNLGLSKSGATLLPPGTLLLCSRATIGEVRIALAEITTNQGFKSLICKPGINNEFVYYKMLTMKQQMIDRSFGSTFLEISKANVAALELEIPTEEEQSAIAAVLSDMDSEIAALEARRDKTRALKQGMMQELLTGRTRLI